MDRPCGVEKGLLPTFIAVVALQSIRYFSTRRNSPLVAFTAIRSLASSGPLP